MPNFYNAPGFSFQDFDLLVDNGFIYACYIKKVPHSSVDRDSKKPNRYGLAKSSNGLNWQEVGDIIMPVPNTWEESIWAGSITKENNKFVIYYTGTTMSGRNNFCKIGKAYSADLIHWEKDPQNPVFVFSSENIYYSDEPKLAFRDPYPFSYEGKNYIIFAAKDKSKPAGKQGCVGIVEEKNKNQFLWMPPLFCPGTYYDGLECPAIYKIKDRWYLLYGIDGENEEKAFRYTIADSPFGPYKTFKDNQLLSSNNYNCRIINFNGKLLCYNWFRDTVDGITLERLAPPKEAHILNDGRLSLADMEI